jgi:hypothetical protein
MNFLKTNYRTCHFSQTPQSNGSGQNSLGQGNRIAAKKNFNNNNKNTNFIYLLQYLLLLNKKIHFHTFDYFKLSSKIISPLRADKAIHITSRDGLSSHHARCVCVYMGDKWVKYEGATRAKCGVSIF